MAPAGIDGKGEARSGSVLTGALWCPLRGGQTGKEREQNLIRVLTSALCRLLLGGHWRGRERALATRAEGTALARGATMGAGLVAAEEGSRIWEVGTGRGPGRGCRRSWTLCLPRLVEATLSRSLSHPPAGFTAHLPGEGPVTLPVLNGETEARSGRPLP